MHYIRFKGTIPSICAVCFLLARTIHIYTFLLYTIHKYVENCYCEKVFTRSAIRITILEMHWKIDNDNDFNDDDDVVGSLVRSILPLCIIRCSANWLARISNWYEAKLRTLYNQKLWLYTALELCKYARMFHYENRKIIVIKKPHMPSEYSTHAHIHHHTCV